MKKRVVVTGMGVAAPNAIGKENYYKALINLKSGITFQEELNQLKFRCQIAGKPKVPENLKKKYFSDLELKTFKASGLIYGSIAGLEAWKDAGLSLNNPQPDWGSGILFGTGLLGVDKFREAIYLIDEKKTKRLGSHSVQQTMASGISAYLGGRLGCGNMVSTNSSACSTGTEAVILGAERIRHGQAKRMLVGSCSDHGPYIWGGFDAMRILPSNYNNNPQAASRPMSASAAGFVPGSGAGALVLEELETAQARNATIYAEILGGNLNSGGQLNGGSMTASNPKAVQKCITQALKNSHIKPSQVEVINGHLTATAKDPEEIRNWKLALNRNKRDFPIINSTKGTIGHCLSAAGSLECIASVLQIYHQKIFGNKNAEDLHLEIQKEINATKIPQKTISKNFSILAKASLGFGDVNAVIIFKKF